MKHNYFEKVENKYVFNLTLIFWHIFIALATLALTISIVILLWGIIPPFKHSVKKEADPQMGLF